MRKKRFYRGGSNNNSNLKKSFFTILRSYLNTASIKLDSITALVLKWVQNKFTFVYVQLDKLKTLLYQYSNGLNNRKKNSFLGRSLVWVVWSLMKSVSWVKDFIYFFEWLLVLFITILRIISQIVCFGFTACIEIAAIVYSRVMFLCILTLIIMCLIWFGWPYLHV